MAQHDYIIANQSGAAFRADLNNGLAAIVSQNSGAAQPSTTYAYQWWADTTTGLLKIRNAANNAWITIGTLASANLGHALLASPTFTGTPAAPTASVGTNTTQLATTAFVLANALRQTGGTLTGALLADFGTAALPGLAFDGDPDTGIFRVGADQLGIATNGVERVRFSTTAAVFNNDGANVDFRIEGSTKPDLFRVDAGTDEVIIDGLTHPSADGTADQALVTNGSGTLSFASRSRLVRATAVATTSGTSIDFTGIPSWVRRVTVILNGVSTNGITGVAIQLGDSGGIETTGYLGSGTAITGTNTCGVSSFSTAFVCLGSIAASVRAGILFLVNITGNTWVASGTFDDGATQAGCTQGAKSLSATLDRIRLTTVNGTDTFDAGTVNIIMEG
jgi:hypothetical protein